MSASISTKKGSIATQYIKRTAGIISGATGEYFKEAMPVTTSTISEARVATSELTQKLSNTTQSILPKIRQLKMQTSFKSINSWFLQKSDEFGDVTGDFDMSFDTDVEGNTAVIAEMQISETAQSANQISRAVVESSHQMVQSQITATANIASTLDKQTAVIATGFDKTNSTLNKILEVLTKNTATIIESTIAQNAEEDAGQNMLASGKFNASEYKKLISKNISNSPELAMLSMIPGILSMGKDALTPELIFGELFKAGVNKAAPKLKNNLGAFDEAVNNALMTSLIRLGEDRSMGTKGFLSRLFGIDASRKEVDTSRSELELKNTSWNTTSQEALTNVLPGYLRQMLIHMGGPDLIYDYKSRKFRTSSHVKQAFRNATTNTDTIWGASAKVREGLRDKEGDINRDTQLLYDLMMQDLGSSYEGGKSKRDLLDSLANNPRATAEYVKKLTDGMSFSGDSIKLQEEFIESLSKVLSDENRRVEISNQAAVSEATRQKRGKEFVQQANAYNMDLSHLKDSPEANRQFIAETYGKKIRGGASISDEPVSAKRGRSGVDYTNKALYEIYRRLDTGINVYVTGKKKIRDDPYSRMKALPPPLDHKPKPSKDGAEVRGAQSIAHLDPGKYGNDPNLLQNQTDEDGNTEELTGGQRFSRWGKSRGKQLMGAIFNGSPDDVKQVVSASISDVSAVAGDALKSGIGKIDKSFGNVSGYLKHKMFGTEYTYETGETKEDGTPVTKTIAGKKDGGIFGFVKTEVQGMFKGAQEKAGKWFSDVSGYFDYGEKDPDDKDGQVKSKRKKLLAASVGAFAGAGILGGPIGMLVGGLAGNALSTMGIGKKIKDFLFGMDENGNYTGILSKAADSIISPIRFQVGKTVSLAAAALKKNVFGPLSDLGYAIKDRMANRIDSIMDTVKEKVTAPFKAVGKFLGKGAMRLLTGVATIGKRAQTTMVGKAARGAINLVTGAFGAGTIMMGNHLGKKAFHKLKRGEEYILYPGDKYFDVDAEKAAGADGGDIHSRKFIKEVDDETVIKYPDGKVEKALTDVGNGVQGVKLIGGTFPTWYPLTKDYIKRRRKKRNAQIDEELKHSGFYGKGGIKGFFGGDYKEWRKKDREERVKRRNRFNEHMEEHVLTPEEIQARENDKKQTDAAERTAENTSSLRELISNEIIPGSSFKTHDQGLWDRLDLIIEYLSGDKPDTNSDGSIKDDTSIIPEDHEDQPEKPKDTIIGNENGAQIRTKTEDSNAPTSNATSGIKKKDTDTLALSLFQSAATVADEGGLDDKDVKTLERMGTSVANGESRQSIFAKFKGILKDNKDKADARIAEEEKKSESFLSKLLGGAGSLLMKYWPVLLGGLTLLSKGFRDWILEEALPTAGRWIKDNLPNIISGLWEGGESINQEIENQATGSETLIDPATHEAKSVTSAERHAEVVENGRLKSAIETTFDPLRLAKDTGIMALERGGLRLGATAVKGAGHLVSGAGKLATGAGTLTKGAGAAINGIAKVGQGASAFFQGVKQYGINKVGLSKGVEFAGRAFALGGSSTANAVSSAGSTIASGGAKVAAGGAKVAAGAGSAKTMFSKMFKPSTWFKPTAVANIAGGIASDAAAGIGWEYAENSKNANIVGNYGWFQNAGGFVRTSTTAKTVTTTTVGIVGGIAIGQAVAAATGAVSMFAVANGWNPAGWCAAVIAGVLAAALLIGNIANLIIGAIGDANDRGYSIRSNAAKMQAVIDKKVEYTNGVENPMYIYCGQESDRVLGLTKGLNVKDPDLMIGQFLKSMAESLPDMPGSEVLFYDLINNMAVQGVPFAVDMVGKSSDEANRGGAQANYDTCGDPPIMSDPFVGFKKTWVSYSDVRDNEDLIYADIAENIGRQDSTCVWTRANLEYVYELGEDVYKKLKKEKIIDGGKVQTKRFKGHPGDKKNAEGWSSLDKICRDEGSYFLTQCLVYINSKIECTKQGKQWLEDRADDVESLMNGLKDFFMEENESKVQELRDRGMSDDEIKDYFAKKTNPKGESANGADPSVTAEPTAVIADLNKTKIKESDKTEISKELKYINAAYAYAHPSFLQEWVEKHQKESGVGIDDVKNISKWNTFTSDKRKKSTLRGQMIQAALKFAESAGDIFGVVDKFDWSPNGKIYAPGNGKKKTLYEKMNNDAGFTIRGGAKKGESILDKVFESANPSEFTPKQVHKKLFGKEEDNKASEAKSTSGMDWTVGGSGQIAAIADMISDYPSSAGSKLMTGDSKTVWKNILYNLPARSPVNLPTGGPEDADDGYRPGETGSEWRDRTENKVESEPEGGNPINKPYKVTSYFGPREYPHSGTHNGVDIIPDGGKGPTYVGSRFNGTIKAVKDNVSDSDKAYKGSDGNWHYGGKKENQTGNMVTIQADNGITIKNMHLRHGSIPASIKKGARVKVGDLIGEMGSTGWSTGDHLHYQLEKDGKAFNPLDSIKGGTKQYTSFNSDGIYNSSSDGASISSSDGSSDDEGETKKPGILAQLIDALKQLGSGILNKITGGLFGTTESSSDIERMNGSSSSGSGSSFSYGDYTITSDTITNVRDFLEMVGKEVGNKEQPANSNRTKYGEWYGMNGVAWCMIFVQWCFDRAGLPLEHKTASCSDLVDWFSRNKPDCIWKAGDGTPKPGDIIIFQKKGAICHTGIIEKVGSATSVSTIEGNTGTGGPNENGGVVARHASQTTPYFAYYIRAVDWEALEAEAKAREAAMSNVGEGAEAMFLYLRSIGYSDEAAAAIVGCWEHESTNKAKVVESDYLSDFKNTFKGDYDEVANNIPKFNDYSSRVAKGRSGYIDKRDGKNYAGLGYAQWTGGRARNLIDFAKSNNAKWYEAGTQLAFLDHEMQSSYKKTYQKLHEVKDIDSATHAFAYGFEHGEMPDYQYNPRLKTARAIYQKLKGSYEAKRKAEIIENDPVEAMWARHSGGPVVEDSHKSEISKDQKYGRVPKNDQLPDPIPPDEKNDDEAAVGGPITSTISDSSHIKIDKKPPKPVKQPKPVSSIRSTLPMGGPEESKDIATDYTSSYKLHSSTIEPASVPANVPSGVDSDDHILELMQQMLEALIAIRSNTGTSSDLLGSINGKEFVDQGVRDTLTALSKAPKKNSAAKKIGTGNNRKITSMAKP